MEKNLYKTQDRNKRIEKTKHTCVIFKKKNS